MGSQNRLLWRETSAGWYERGIDELEQFYASLSKTWEGTGHTYFSITACTGVTMTFQTGLPAFELRTAVEEALRSGWRRLHYDHPTLAGPVEWDESLKSCKKVYQELCSEDEVESWMNETFSRIEGWKSGIEFANSDPPIGRFAKLYLVFISDIQPNVVDDQLSFDVIFRSSHDLIDGIGTLNLLNNLFRHTAAAFSCPTGNHKLHFGDQHKNLSPPFRIAANIPPVPSAVQSAKLEQKKEGNKAAQDGVEVFSIPFNAKASMPGSAQRTAIHLTSEETTMILAKCKVLRVTATQVFHTAIALAVKDLQEPTGTERMGKYISYSLMNLRSSCKSPYDTPLHAASVYHSVSDTSLIVDLKVPAKTPHKMGTSAEEFLSTLGQVKDFYESVQIDEDYLSIVPALFQAVTLPYPETPHAVPQPSKYPSVSLSSMGLVDKIVQPEHGPFKIHDPWVIGSDYSTGLGLFLGTWKGIMSLSAGYNAAFHGLEDVLLFLEDVKHIVLKGLQLEQDS